MSATLASPGIRCAKWCGFGCTQAAYDQATAEAAALAARLGEGWTPGVWENGGWHYSAIKGKAAVHAYISGSAIRGGWTVTGYTAFVDTVPQVVVSADEPDEALGLAVQDARTIAQRLADDLADIST